MCAAVTGNGASVIDEHVLASVRARLSLELDPSIANPFSKDPERTAIIRQAIARALADVGEDASPDDRLVDVIHDELIGLGPLQPFMSDPTITDILVNRHDEIYLERDGRLHHTDVKFRDQGHLEQVIQKIVALVGRELSVEKPVVDARMVDGSRANAVYAPVGGPSLCIRKFNRLRMRLRDADHLTNNWVDGGGMSEPMARFLGTAALARATMLIVGATGSGKSTLLRSLVDSFPARERVITIEDTAELELDNPHWVKLECVHAHELGGNDTSTRRLDVADLVQNALRMRPDRLIIGEIRNSREAYHTLEALNTGHDGSATTIHASSAVDALARLELLLGRHSAQLSRHEIRGYITRVFNLIIFISRLRSGRRCVLEVCELAGMTSDGEYDLRSVFATDIEHSSGDPHPRFGTADGYAPGERLARKLQLEGLSWTS